MSKNLNWGETPWDSLTRDELLREVQRMYSAMSSLSSCLRMQKSMEPLSPYWSTRGSGGKALARADQIEESLAQNFDRESIYRSFFRYADDLLFTGLGHDWTVCPKCDQMRGGADLIGKPCSEASHGITGCDGIMRPLEWSDLAKK